MGAVAPPSFYSDRTNGPAPRLRESLSDETLNGLAALVRRRIDSHWLADEFPEQCPDGNGVAGTDHRSLTDELLALIPGIEWPPPWGAVIDQGATFDLIEYVARRVAAPSQGYFHDYFRHHELTFDKREGRRRFREDVNLILTRGGAIFELNENLQIERHGAPETHQALDQLRPVTGDATLDQLIESGRTGYLSRKREDRETAVEKLWDAFERLKTLDDPSNKGSSGKSVGHGVVG